jgi:hypothetical protein
MCAHLRGRGVVAGLGRRYRAVAVAVSVAILALIGVVGWRERAADRPQEPLLGAYLGSGADGVERVSSFERWLGAPVTVGRTYLGGQSWHDIAAGGWAIDPWAQWKNRQPGRLLVINVPLLQPNEPPLDDATVHEMLHAGASGAFDPHFRALGEHLVRVGAQDVILDLGWEMNGISYSSRCHPAPATWTAHYRRVVSVLRAVPGQAFRFEFTPDRGQNAIDWTFCYPGDDVVDIIGMHTYDQPPGQTFQEYATQPLGLDAAAEFARARHKRLAIPEWGLRDHPDNAEYVTGMFDWTRANDVLYHSISDYCPHGIWRCGANPNASTAYRSLFGHQ